MIYNWPNKCIIFAENVYQTVAIDASSILRKLQQTPDRLFSSLVFLPHCWQKASPLLYMKKINLSQTRNLIKESNAVIITKSPERMNRETIFN